MMAAVFENRVEGTDPQRFHRSAVRWTDLSVKTMVGLFTTLDSEVDAIRLTTALGSRKLETLKVLIFCLNIQGSDKLPSKEIAQAIALLRPRYVCLGSRLKSLSCTGPDGSINWQETGIYRFSECGTELVHIQGERQTLPQALQGLKGTFVNGHCEKTAQVSFPGGLSVQLSMLFQGKLFELTPLPEVSKEDFDQQISASPPSPMVPIADGSSRPPPRSSGVKRMGSLTMPKAKVKRKP